jgi:type IV pilus assembly protein PilW
MHISKHQAGLSLIELMVAMVISSVLIIGVTQIFIDNKRGYIFQQNQSENQEGSRFTLLLLQNELAKAGYRRQPDVQADQAFPALAGNISGCGVFTAGQTVKFINSSSLCIRYQPRNAQDRDCIGNAVQANTAVAIANPYTQTPEIFTERFWLNNNELTCTREVAGATHSGALVSGMVDLRFELGVGANSAARDISSYTTGDPGTQPILAVRFGGLFRSSSQQLRENADADAALLNWKNLTNPSNALYAAIKAGDTGQIYQVAQGTVTLRNRTP